MEAHSDRIIHGILMGGEARVLLCETTGMAEAARRTHDTSRVCTAALGRGISAAAMLSAMLKSSDASLTMTLRGDGPAGALVMVARPGVVKAYIDHPYSTLPPRPDGKLDVGGVIGHHGRITVVKDLGMREPYVGQCNLASGEIAEDIALYCTVSEQQPTLCALGVLVADTVISSAGILIQPLPGCSEETLHALEVRASLFSDISVMLQRYTLEGILDAAFQGLTPQILATNPLRYQCDCTRERMERVLISMGRDELEDMIEKQNGAEITCHFCHTHHAFSASDLQSLLLYAQKPSVPQAQMP